MLEIGMWLKEIFGASRSVRRTEGVIHHAGKRGGRGDERRSSAGWIVNPLGWGLVRCVLSVTSPMLLTHREALVAELGVIVYQGANAASPLGEPG